MRAYLYLYLCISFQGRKVERVLSSMLDIAEKHFHIIGAAGCDVGSLNGWTRFMVERLLYKGAKVERAWNSKTLHENNSISCICTTLCLVCLLCRGLFPQDLPFIVAVSVGNLPLPHWNMWSGCSSPGMTDKGTGRTQVCREVKAVD